MYKNLNNVLKENYKKYLQLMSKLSPLFSENKVPFLHYRAHENLFCFATGATNLSRSDIAIDAQYQNIGIGLKTFIFSNGFQKIAEFNAKNYELEKCETADEIINKIVQWRNDRLEFTLNNYEIDKLLYHCLTRREGEFQISEFEMEIINDFKIIEDKNNSIHFKTKKNTYKYDKSKSTLYKKFDVKNNIIETFEAPIDQNSSGLVDIINQLSSIKNMERDYVVLPLYSTKKGEKFVFTQSGINQWNAAGRKRNKYEVYIPVSMKVHNIKPDFFPKRDVKFNMTLPNNEVISCKLCQDNSKALMSSPNKDLGKWLFSINIGNEDRPITMSDLDYLNIDSVIIEKIDNENYTIDFSKVGSFERFLEENEKI